MNSKLLLVLVSGSLLLAGCKSSYIDARKTGPASPRTEPSSPVQLTDQDVFGNELTLDITEEDIQNAVEEAQGSFEIPLYSAVVLVKSGSRAPDAMMQKEMQKYYRVSTFSGIPAVRKKHTVQSVKPVKEADSDTVESYTDGKSGVINANYMQALRYVSAKGRHKAIVVYWGEMETGKYNSTAKEMVWKKYNGEKLVGASLRYLIRFALVDVASGEWATYSPVNTELLAVPLTVKTDGTDATEQQIISLEQTTSKMVVEDLVNRYSRK